MSRPLIRSPQGGSVSDSPERGVVPGGRRASRVHVREASSSVQLLSEPFPGPHHELGAQDRIQHAFRARIRVLLTGWASIRRGAGARSDAGSTPGDGGTTAESS